MSIEQPLQHGDCFSNCNVIFFMIEICDFSINEKITLLEAIKALDCPPTDYEKITSTKVKKDLEYLFCSFLKKEHIFRKITKVK